MKGMLLGNHETITKLATAEMGKVWRAPDVTSPGESGGRFDLYVAEDIL